MEPTNKLKNSKEVIAYLAEQFPACFSIQGDAKPLKVGIFHELAERLKEDEKVTKTLLRSALRQYTSSWRYLHSVKVGSHRVDLDGEQGLAIEQEHMDHAQQTLKESKERAFEQRKKAQAEAKAKQDANSESTKPATARKTRANPPKRSTNRKPNQVQKPAAVLKQVAVDSLKSGKEIKVLVGKTPMSATIQEVTKDGVSVQLQSGMQVKVKPEHIVE